MKPEEIKIGETYYVRVKADSKDLSSVYCQLIDADGNGSKALSFYNWVLYSFTPVPPAPKYDPCRPFKKGDKVKLREKVQGRETSQFVTGLSLGKIYTVETDEFNHTVDIVGDEGLGRYSFVHLELVTPVEELEPYTVVESYGRTDVMKGDYIIATYTDSHPHAKEAAEAERDRLNAEYRKEQNND